MARLGEGDPRWIVEERKDGVNVNNWHWTEKDMTSWASNVLKDSLLDTTYQDDKGSWKISHVTASGVAALCVRKGKLKTIYDLEIKIDFKSEIDKNTTVDGRIEIPEFSFDTKENVQYNISIDVKSETSDKVNLHVKSTCKVHIKPILLNFISLLTKQADDMKLPQNNQISDKLMHVEAPATKHNKTNNSLYLKSLEIEDEFYCSSDFLFQAFTHQDKLTSLTRSAVHFDAKVGASYSLLDGSVYGTIKHIEPQKVLEMSWRFKDWPEGQFSEVVIAFIQLDEGVRLQITHSGIPGYDQERVRHGWERYFLAPIEQVFMIGSKNSRQKIF